MYLHPLPCLNHRCVQPASTVDGNVEATVLSGENDNALGTRKRVDAKYSYTGAAEEEDHRVTRVWDLGFKHVIR